MRPRCDSTRGVLSSGGLGHLAVVPPSGLAPLARHGVCRVSSWNRRRPTTSAACHDPRTEPRIPIPADIQPAVLRLSTGLVRTRTPRCGGRPSAGGSEEAERRSRPRITISPEHRLSSPRAFEDRERSSQPLEATEVSSSTPSRERAMWPSRPGAFPHQPPTTVSRASVRTERRCSCERSLPDGASVTTRSAGLDGPYVPEWLGRKRVGSAPQHHPADRSVPMSSATEIGRAHV